MSIKLYNAGDRIQEVILYSIQPANERGNWLARFPVDAPAQSFFTIDTEQTIAVGGAQLRVPVHFAEDFVKKHGKRGVVMLKTDTDATMEDELPFAKTEEDAMEKGHRLWMSYLAEVVANHLQECADRRAAGMAPRPANHFTRRAMKLTGTPDPGERIFVTNQEELYGPQKVEAENMSKKFEQQLEEMRQMLSEQQRQHQMELRKLQAKLALEKEEKFDAALAEPKKGK